MELRVLLQSVGKQQTGHGSFWGAEWRPERVKDIPPGLCVTVFGVLVFGKWCPGGKIVIPRSRRQKWIHAHGFIKVCVH